MDDLEVQNWIGRLRLPKPLSHENQLELANMLERLWSKKRGRPPRSKWTWWEIEWHNVMGGWCWLEVERHIQEMKKRGERPRGGRRAQAEAIVAEQCGITVRALQKRMQNIPHPKRN
jgi:hypothetical protein